MLRDDERMAIARLWSRKLDQDACGLPQAERHRNLEPASAEFIRALAAEGRSLGRSISFAAARHFVGGPRVMETEEGKAFCRVVDRWRTQGVDIDWCWVRTIAEVDAQLDAWLGGDLRPVDLV